MINQHEKEKPHFLIERIAFFSDAVIAIAVTLLIIEIKAPIIIAGTTLTEQIDQLIHLIPEFMSFIISFAVIYSQWIKHHTMFGYLINYDHKLITLNSFYLFTTAIIPFSTSYFALNNNTEFHLPLIVYSVNLFFLTLFNFSLFRHIINEKNKLFDNSISKTQLKWVHIDYLTIPVAIIFGFLAGLINYKLIVFSYVPFFMIGLYSKRQKNKKQPLTAPLQ